MKRRAGVLALGLLFTVLVSAVRADISTNLIEGASVTGELTVSETAWFHCSTVTGQYYGVVVTGNTANVSIQLVGASLGFITNRVGRQLGWTSTDDGGYDVGLSSTGDTPFVLRFYSFTNTIARTTEWIEEKMTTWRVVGLSVALVDGQEIAWARGFGHADLENGIPVTTNTVFRIGSVSKAFTATATLQYRDRGKLGLDDPVTNYLPGLRLLYRYPDTDSITLRDLLDHHSGLPGDLDNAAFTTEPVGGRYAWLTNYLVGTYPIYPRCQVYSYCNSGFTLMGGVIEAADGSGAPFTTLVNSNLFEPLGMDSTSFLKDKPAIVSQLAKPYVNGQVMPEEFINIYATGGMYSRPVDLAQYIRMILAGGVAPGGTRILETNSVAEMLTPQATDAPFNTPVDPRAGSTVGLGWDSVRWPALSYAGDLAAKGGATLAYHAYMAVLPDLDLGFAITISSTAADDPGAMVFVLQHAVSDKYGIPVPTNTVYFPAATQAMSQAELDALAGIYATGDGYHRVEAHPGSLTLVLNADSDEPTSVTDMLLRTDGWFSVGASPINGMLITNIAGRAILVWRSVEGTHALTNFWGERVNLAPLSAAWSNRLGKGWYVLDESPATYHAVLGQSARLTFTNRDGILLVQKAYAEGSQVLSPTNDNLAFLCGMVNRDDSAVQVFTSNSIEYLRYRGFTYQPADSFPVLYPGSMTNLSLAAGETRWFAVPGWTGDPQGLTITNASAPLLLNLYTSDGSLLGRGTNALPWICPTDGTYCLSVGAMSGATGNLRAYSLTNTIAQAIQWIGEQMTNNGVVGLSVALVDGQDIAWARGFGYADRENGIPVTTDTVFRIGSVSKMFTTTAAMQYRDQGKLDLDDPVTNYLPGLRLLYRYPGADSITIRNLLDHHSGLPGDLLNSCMTTEPLGSRYAWLTNYLAGTYPIYPPRQIFSYCNSGFVLMQGVIEAADGSGTPFTSLLDTNVFQPLGMEGTSFLFDKPAVTGNLARVYVGGDRFPDEYINMYGTGAMYSRPVDMAQYIRMILADGIAPDGARILDTDSVAEMLTPQETDAPFEPFAEVTVGLGWDTVKWPSLSYAGDLAWKSGETAVYCAHMAVLPDRDLGFAITISSPAQIYRGAVDFILQKAVSDKCGIPVPTNSVYFPAATQAVSQAELDALAGIYASKMGCHWVESHPGSLTLVLNADSDEPTSVTNMLLRTDGWFSPGDTPTMSVLITNIAGRTVLVQRSATVGYATTNLVGERFNPAPLSAAWSNRLGKTWYVLDDSPVSYMVVLGFSPCLTFTNRDGILLVQAGYVGSQVLSPTNDNVAFICGLVNRGDSAVQVYDVSGREYIQFHGYQFGPQPPVLPVNASTSGTVSVNGQSIWYEIQPSVEGSGLIYELRLDNAPGSFFLRVYDFNAGRILDKTAAGELFQFSANGPPLYVQVQPGLNGNQTGSFNLAYSYPLLVRELARAPDGRLVITWQGETGAVYIVNAADVLGHDDQFYPLSTNRSDTAHFQSVTNAMDPVPSRFYRMVKEQP